MSAGLTIIIGLLTAAVSVAGVIIWDICKDRSQRSTTLRGGYRWLSVELSDNHDWIRLNQTAGEPKEKEEAQSRLLSRGLLNGMRTVSVSALHYVITSAGPTRLVSTEDYRVFVTLEDTLGILRDEWRALHLPEARSSGYVNVVKPKVDAIMELAVKQIDAARQLVDERLSRW